MPTGEVRIETERGEDKNLPWKRTDEVQFLLARLELRRRERGTRTYFRCEKMDRRARETMR